MPRADLSRRLARVLADLHADNCAPREPDTAERRGSLQMGPSPAVQSAGALRVPDSIVSAASPGLFTRDTVIPEAQQDASLDAMLFIDLRTLHAASPSWDLHGPSISPGGSGTSLTPSGTPNADSAPRRARQRVQPGLDAGVQCASLDDQTRHGGSRFFAVPGPQSGRDEAHWGLGRETPAPSLLLRGEESTPLFAASANPLEFGRWGLQSGPRFPYVWDPVAQDGLLGGLEGSGGWSGAPPLGPVAEAEWLDSPLMGDLPGSLASPGAVDVAERAGVGPSLEREERGAEGGGGLSLEDAASLLEVRIGASSAPPGAAAAPQAARMESSPFQGWAELRQDAGAWGWPHASNCQGDVASELEPGSGHSLPPLRLCQPHQSASAPLECLPLAPPGPSTSPQSVPLGRRSLMLADASSASDGADLRFAKKLAWTAVGLTRSPLASDAIRPKQEEYDPAVGSRPRAKRGGPDDSQGLFAASERSRAQDGTVVPARPPRPLRLRPGQLQLVPAALRRLSRDDMACCLQAWAAAISGKNWGQTKELERVIRSASSPVGNAVQRMGHIFLKSLKLRMALESSVGTPEDHQRRLEASLPQRPPEPWQVARYHELVPLMSLCATVAFGAILDAAQHQSRVHVIFLGSQMTNPVGNRTLSLAHGLANLPQGPPRHVRFTIVDFSFWMSPRAASTQAKLGRAALQSVQAQAARLKLPHFEAEWLHVGVDNLVDLYTALEEPWVSASSLDSPGPRAPRQHGVYVCSMMQLSKIPVEAAEGMSPRDSVLQWLCQLRPDVLAFVESDVDQGASLESRMRGCLRHFGASMAMHDHILAAIPSADATGGDPPGSHSPPKGDIKWEDSKDLLKKRKRDVVLANPGQPDAATAALYASEESFCGRFMCFSLAPPEQRYVFSLNIAQWRQLFRAAGFEEMAPDPATLALVHQYMGGMPLGLQAKVVGGTMFFTWMGEPLFFTSLWTWPS